MEMILLIVKLIRSDRNSVSESKMNQAIKNHYTEGIDYFYSLFYQGSFQTVNFLPCENFQDKF